MPLCLRKFYGLKMRTIPDITAAEVPVAAADCREVTDGLFQPEGQCAYRLMDQTCDLVLDVGSN
jgi:hypothetical protein